MAKVEITKGVRFEGVRTICTAHYPLLEDQVKEAFDTHAEAIAFRDKYLAAGRNVSFSSWVWREHKADAGFWSAPRKR